MMKKFAIAIHGGAGTITRENLSEAAEKAYRLALETALQAGYALLETGASALDAVEATVVALENCDMFNAGKGSVFTRQGGHEMDASIMEGSNLAAGAVTGVRNLKNPIKLARCIMEKSDHVFLSYPGAEEFARLHHLEFEPDPYFYNQLRYDQWQQIRNTDTYQLDHTEDLPDAPFRDNKFGTVGAVALDQSGNLAAATSSGGMTNKNFNRIGDSPLIGAGTYANNKTCAVSCTGHGELFIRSVVAYDVSCLMEYKNLSLQEACDLVVHDKLVKIKGEGGLIAIDRAGNIALPFNSEGMYRASRKAGEEVMVAIYGS
jgi:beta-aspartyl-peptidase (threonine type)